MTTTEVTLDSSDVYSPEQTARLAALEGVAGCAWALSGTVNPAVLIELAEWVIGDDEPFDPVAEAHKAMAAIKFERSSLNNYDDGEAGWTDMGGESGTLADWKREMSKWSMDEPIEGDITVSDLAGFLTLPTTAILEDADGDIWHNCWKGWTYAGVDTHRSPSEVFHDLGWGPNGEFDFIVTNPEVLS